MFIPGETIIHRFNLPFPNYKIARIYVNYKQKNKIILTKIVFAGEVKEASSGTNSYFTVMLSQEESLLFKDDTNYKMQLNVLFTSGTRCASIELDGINGLQHIRKVVTVDE